MRMQSQHPETLKLPLMNIVIVVAIVALAFLWSWKGSGVLWATQSDALPEGYYAYYVNSPFGLWPLNKENFYYMAQHQAFLGVEGAYIERGGGFEFMRSLYATLTLAFWFLGPLFSGIMVNVLCWVSAAFSSQYIARILFGSQLAGNLAATFVILGQGFLHRVGEVSPHLMGHSLGYWLVALAVHMKIWNQKTDIRHQALIYLIIGVLKLGYETSWLFLPPVLVFSFWSLRFEPVFKQICAFGLFLALATLPSGAIMLLSQKFHALGSTHYNGASLLLSGKIDVRDFLYLFGINFFEGLLAYGPILVPVFLWGVVRAISNRECQSSLISLIFIVQLLYTTLFTMAVSGKGYITFAISPLFMVVFVYGLIELEKLFKNQVILVSIFLSLACINHLNFIGIPYFLRAFELGYFSTYQSKNWKHYEPLILS